MYPGLGNIHGCTLNFLFTNSNYSRYFFGMASHCFDSETSDLGTGGLVCNANLPPKEQDALGSETSFQGTRYRLVYTAWRAMAEAGGESMETCDDSDFAVVEIMNNFDYIHPANKVIGGPTCLAETAPAANEEVWFVGASILWGLNNLHERNGAFLTTAPFEYTAKIDLGTEKGDSGGPLYTKDGCALAGLHGSAAQGNTPFGSYFSRIDTGVNYANTHSDLDLQLVTWSEWSPSTAIPV